MGEEKVKKKVGRPKKSEEAKLKDEEHKKNKSIERRKNKTQPMAIDTKKKRKASQPAFRDVVELEKAIFRYFESCKNNYRLEYDAEGNTIKIQEPLPYTMSGLARALGISRMTLLNYKNKSKEFKDVVEEAKQIVEEYAETQLYINRNAAGIIFNLKNNFGWRDKQEIEAQVDNNITVIPPKFD